MYLNDKSLEIQKEGAWGRYTSAGRQDNSRLGWRSTYVGLVWINLHWSLGCCYDYTGVVLVRSKEMVICRWLLHLSSGLLCPTSQRVWDQLPSTLLVSFISKFTSISCKAFEATQFGAGKWCGCTQALCSLRPSPAGQQELGKWCQDEPSSCQRAHRMEMQPDKSEAVYRKR